MYDLRVEETSDKKFKISLSDFKYFIVTDIYFIGKFGNDANDYIQAIENYIPDSSDRLHLVDIEFLKYKPVNNEHLIIYVDTPFKSRFEFLLDAGHKPEFINDVVEQEIKMFSNIEEILRKHNHLIIQ
jgi:hypothetical protein